MTTSTMPYTGEAIPTATTPLRGEEVALYRSISKSAGVLILLYRLGRPSGAAELALILDMHRETVAAYLASLALVGLVTRLDHNKGYRVTDDGRQLLLQLPGNFLIDETHVNNPANQPHVLDVAPHSDSKRAQIPTTSKALVSGVELIGLDEGTPLDGAASMSKFPTSAPHGAALPALPSGAMSGISTSNVEKTDMPLKKEEDLKSFKEQEESSSNLTDSSADVEKTDIAGLLNASELLFGQGRPVFTVGLDVAHMSRQAVLGWLAQAYTQRQDLDNPPGLVYSHLKSFTLPERRFLDDPASFLPRVYLVAVGLATPDEEPAPELDDQEKRKVQNAPFVLDDPDPGCAALDERRNGGTTTSINQAWQAVLGQLQMEMPRASFDLYVRDTQPVAWDEERAVLTVAARNAYARDWVESRLLSTVSRLLCGILDRAAVDIRFVCEEK